MEQTLILTGAGGCMREILWQIEEQNRTKKVWKVLGYVDVKPHEENGSSDLSVGSQSYPYLGDDEFLLAQTQETKVAVCVGDPALRKKIACRLMDNPNLKFPPVILGNTKICRSVKIGQGCIVSMDCRISTNVTLGEFVFLNIGALICHDGMVGSYSTLSPDVKLAGNVTVGEESDLGMGTRIIQGITLGSKVVTGAGSVVIRDIEDSCMAAGIPAEIRKRRETWG